MNECRRDVQCLVNGLLQNMVQCERIELDVGRFVDDRFKW